MLPYVTRAEAMLPLLIVHQWRMENRKRILAYYFSFFKYNHILKHVFTVLCQFQEKEDKNSD